MVSEVSKRRTRRESLRVRRGLEGMLLIWFGLGGLVVRLLVRLGGVPSPRGDIDVWFLSRSDVA